MHSSPALLFSTASFLFSLPVSAGLYPKSSAVLSLDAKSYDRLITKSNHTSVSILHMQLPELKLTKIKDCRVLRSVVWPVSSRSLVQAKNV
jgi:hypothetical protein